jgi:hypothetical protein
MISKKKAALLGQAFLRNPLEFWDRIITQAEFQMDKIRRPFVHNTMDPATLIQVRGERMETGALTPDHLRSRWQLERGRTRRVLPQLVSNLSTLDIFLHDSLHTYRNMTFEFKTAWRQLRKGGVLLSDDVAMNRAFQNFFRPNREVFSAIDGRDLFGVAVKPH